jgi:hypothetical protein
MTHAAPVPAIAAVTAVGSGEEEELAPEPSLVTLATTKKNRKTVK